MKSYRNFYIKNVTLFIVLLLFLVTLSVPKLSQQLIHTAALAHAQVLQPAIADKVLRFHVLANSDSKEDQTVKLQVRNAIGAYLQPFLEASSSREQSEAIVSEQLDQIAAIANAILAENGYDYRASATICTTAFPEKSYGSYTFPAGNYNALAVTLGDGDGSNWWCVLYPNLCFRGSMYEVLDTDSAQALREVLSSDEYEAVLKSGNYKIRFKLLEYLH